MIPGKEVSMAGFVCIFIVLLKNLHAMMNFLAKITNRCTKSTFLRHYQVKSDLLQGAKKSRPRPGELHFSACV